MKKLTIYINFKHAIMHPLHKLFHYKNVTCIGIIGLVLQLNNTNKCSKNKILTA